ncbi:MAG: DUF362 domain-containing protein [Desulfatirhabdiaceae bacterium]
MDKKLLKEKVAIVKYDRTFDSFAKALNLCDGLDKLKADDKVLLKPNILWGGTKSDPPFGRVTTSTMVGYVLQALRDRGCSNITIGEGTISNKELGSTTVRGFDWSGIGNVAKRYGARLIDFNSETYENVQLENIRVKISKCALDCDFLIDLPVLKAHRQTKVTLGMKNLKGCLSLKSKQRFHKHDLNHMITLLNTKLRPSLTIIDGIYGLEKGPDFLGSPRRMDLIIAGKDVFSCDIVGAMVMGIPPVEVEYLKDFASMTGRTVSLDAIDVKGESIDQVAQKFEWQLSVEEILHQAGINGITIQEKGFSSCSGCLAILTALTAVLTKDSPDTTLDGVEVCMGSEVTAKTESKKVFLLGDCAVSANKDLKEAIQIKGCPPPILNTVMGVVLKCLPPQKAAKILTQRTVKNIGMKIGLYHEAFPIFGVYDPQVFDKKDF